MKSVIGQSLRFGGMLIEMLGVAGIVSGRGDIESLRCDSPTAPGCRRLISCSPWDW